MKEASKQLGIRIPASQYNELKRVAFEREINITDLIISIFDNYLCERKTGLCSSCHTQNNPDSQYCQKCGSSLSPGAPDPFKKYKDERDELISEVDRVLEILEPYKPLIELTNEFSKEDIALLIRLSDALMKNKDLMREMVEKVHEKEGGSK